MKDINKLFQTKYMQYFATFSGLTWCFVSLFSLFANSASLCMCAIGAHTNWPSPSLLVLQSSKSPLRKQITDDEGSWLVSLLLLTSLPGCLLGGFLCEKIGRKKTLLLGGLAVLIPWFLIIFGKAIEVLYIARIIAGLGQGISTLTSSIYISEISEDNVRGRLGTSVFVVKILGSVSILSIGPYVSYTALGIIGAIFPFLFLVSFVWMPESPLYLIKVGNLIEAKQTLFNLSSSNVTEESIEKRILLLKKTLERKSKIWTTVLQFLLRKEYRKPLFIMLGVKTFHQLSGQMAIESYMQTIISISQSSISPENSSIIFGVIQIPAVLMTSILCDKVGRKALIVISLTGCAISLFGEGTYFYVQDVLAGDVASIAWLPTTGLAVYMLMSPIGVSTVPYVLMCELFPSNVKEIGVVIITFYGSILAFMVSKVFRPLSTVWGISTLFWIFSGICFMGVIFIIMILPETKGKSLVEIQAKLNKKRIRDEVKT